ncbi:MAG: signal peptidase II [Oscillospiraceae bacterium]|nr:signal peptidase II [Oscillospiraceae bacterium]
MMVIILIIFGIILVAADQVIKLWMVRNLMPVETMDFIRFGDFEVLGLRYCENTGAAFSSFRGEKWFLIILVSVMLIGMLIFTIKYKYKHPFFLVSSVMVISGGLGNLIDRIRQGYVVDYLDVKLFNFAVFNFADICVVLGAIFMLIWLFFIEPRFVKEESDGQA